MNPNKKYSRYYTFVKPVITNPIIRSTAPYIFSLVTITVFTIFVIKPTISTILELHRQITEKQQVLTALNAKAQNLTQGKRNYESISPEIKLKISRAVPSQADVPYLISSLQNTTANTASISSLQVDPVILVNSTKTTGGELSLNEVGFSFNIQSSYNQLLETLMGLNKSSRIIKINNVLISKPQDNGAISLSVAGKSFFLK